MPVQFAQDLRLQICHCDMHHHKMGRDMSEGQVTDRGDAQDWVGLVVIVARWPMDSSHLL
jgi:hypothetical protein